MKITQTVKHRMGRTARVTDQLFTSAGHLAHTGNIDLIDLQQASPTGSDQPRPRPHVDPKPLTAAYACVGGDAGPHRVPALAAAGTHDAATDLGQDWRASSTAQRDELGMSEKWAWYLFTNYWYLFR